MLFAGFHGRSVAIRAAFFRQNVGESVGAESFPQGRAFHPDAEFPRVVRVAWRPRKFGCRVRQIVSLAKSAGLISPNTAGLGQHLVESDHTRPVSESADSIRTQIGDIAHVIANWHRLPHRRRPWLTVDSLKSLPSITCESIIPRGLRTGARSTRSDGRWQIRMRHCGGELPASAPRKVTETPAARQFRRQIAGSQATATSTVISCD